MLVKYIKKLTKGENLTFDEAKEAMDAVLDGGATPVQISAYLTALRMKGETIEEISGSAAMMNSKAIGITPNVSNYVDCVGTGGDGTNTFNISTTAAFVMAGAGVKTAKHGNRAVSSKCGSADVLEGLGVNIMLTPEQVKECVEKIGIGFMFARTMHPSMKTVSGVRGELKIRTIFNILGPLSNPSNAKVQLIGVFSPDMTHTVAGVMKNLGIVSGMSYSAMDNGMDEISITGKTKISEIKNGEITDYIFSPEDVGLTTAPEGSIIGGTVEENVQTALNILKGEKGAKRDVVVLNAGAAIYSTGAASSIEEGVRMAEQAIDNGSALEKLNQLISLSNSYK